MLLSGYSLQADSLTTFHFFGSPKYRNVIVLQLKMYGNVKWWIIYGWILPSGGVQLGGSAINRDPCLFYDLSILKATQLLHLSTSNMVQYLCQQRRLQEQVVKMGCHDNSPTVWSNLSPSWTICTAGAFVWMGNWSRFTQVSVG